MKIVDWQAIIAAVAAGLAWFIGGGDGLLYALAAFCAADYITGVLAAAVKGELSSKVGAKGIARKLMIFVLVGIATLADRYVLNDGNLVRSGVMLFYVSNEGISVLENAAALGLPVPEALRKAIRGSE